MSKSSRAAPSRRWSSLEQSGESFEQRVQDNAGGVQAGYDAIKIKDETHVCALIRFNILPNVLECSQAQLGVYKRPLLWATVYK